MHMGMPHNFLAYQIKIPQLLSIIQGQSSSVCFLCPTHGSNNVNFIKTVKAHIENHTVSRTLYKCLP